MRHVFLIGSNGIPASYGGFETFVEQLTAHRKDPEIFYHVSCLSEKKGEFEYNHARCFQIKVPKLGPAKVIYYDTASLGECCRYIKHHKLADAVVYMLGCGVGPVFGHYKRKLHRLGAKLMINPDGLEWKRDKWSPLVRRYLKWSEKRMVKHSDLVICDSRKIEEYIKTEYSAYEPNTTFIAYGADLSKSTLTAEAPEAQKWFAEKKVMPNEYYLAVGRFVPENNFQTMLTEFMSSTTRRDFVLITDVKQNQFYEILKEKTGFDQDPRIKFVGTVYDQNLLKFIREHAYGYIHGHEVGGTNPSLLEALASTKMNLLLGVGFNREVGGQGALYWEKKTGSLSKLIGDCDSMSEDDRQEFERKAKERITSYYNWDHIARIYEKCFKGELL